MTFRIVQGFGLGYECLILLAEMIQQFINTLGVIFVFQNKSGSIFIYFNSQMIGRISPVILLKDQIFQDWNPFNYLFKYKRMQINDGDHQLMSKAMFQRPEVVNYFLQLIQEFGGIEKVSWVSVARKLYSTYQFKMRSSQILKNIYESITANDYIELNLKELGLMVQSFVEYRGESRGARKRFKELSQIDMAHNRFAFQARQALLKFCKDIMQMFSRRRKHNFIDYQKNLVQSILAFLSACDLKDQSDPTLVSMQIQAIKLKEYLLQYAKVCHLDFQNIFAEMQMIMKRRDTVYFIYYISFIFQLRQIFLNRYQSDDQLFNHPLLEKTIKRNKHSLIYKLLIDKSDNEDKYELYNTIKLQDNNAYKMQINQMLPNHQKVQQVFNRQLQIKKVEIKKSKIEKKFKMFRGLLTQEGDFIEKGWKTVIFKNEEDEDNEDNDIAEFPKKQNRIESLYQRTFGTLQQ